MKGSRNLMPLLAAFTIASSPAGSANLLERGVTFQQFGSGTSSCGTWTQARRQPVRSYEREVNEAWVVGFLSGSNLIIVDQFDTDILAHRDAQGLWAWIDNYCSAHPLTNIGTAADLLVRELVPKGEPH